MGALATPQAAVFDIAHLLRGATRQHLRYQALVVGRLVARMGVGKRGPVIGKDLLEDTPVPRGVGHHRVTPSGGDEAVVSRFRRFVHPSSACTQAPLTRLCYPGVMGTSGTEKMKNPRRSRNLTKSPFLALPATAGSNAAY